MERNRRRDRPTNTEVQESFFKMDRTPHYSQDVKRKIKMGRDAIASGKSADDVCKTLFGVLNKDMVNLMLNKDKIE